MTLLYLLVAVLQLSRAQFELSKFEGNGVIDLQAIAEQNKPSEEDFTSLEKHECDFCTVAATTIFQEISLILDREGHEAKFWSPEKGGEVLGDVCTRRNNTFTRYGLKNVGGKKVLSGPALPAYHQSGVSAAVQAFGVPIYATCLNIMNMRGARHMWSAFRECGGAITTYIDFVCKGKCGAKHFDRLKHAKPKLTRNLLESKPEPPRPPHVIDINSFEEFLDLKERLRAEGSQGNNQALKVVEEMDSMFPPPDVKLEVKDIKRGVRKRVKRKKIKKEL